MSLGSTFHRKADSSWYREKQEEEWSPRSQESDPDPSFDSDKENHESNVISISTDSSSGLSSFESPLPWAKISSFSHPSPSTSLVLHSQANKVHHEGDKRTELAKEYVPRSNSLVIGKRSRAIGLKDIDLTRNRAAKHIREAKEANKSPTKKHLFSPLSRHMSCPSFSTSIERPSDRQGETGKTGQTGLSRGLNFELDSQVKSPVVSSAAKKVAGKTSSNFVRLFSCPDDQGSIPVEEADCDWCEGHTTTTNPGVVQSSGKLCLKSAPKSVEVIDLTINEEPSHRKVNDENKKSDYKRISERAYGDVGAQKTAGQNLLPVRKRVSKQRSAFSFSDDEDSDSGGKSHLKSDQETPKEPAGADQESHKKTHSRQGFMKMCTFFMLCALLLSIYLHVNPHGFCLDSEFTKNISGIGLALKSELYGQHIAQKIVTAALKNHFNTRNIRKPLVLSFHGWTGIGKNFVSNIITEHFFKHKTHSPFVHSLSSRFTSLTNQKWRSIINSYLGGFREMYHIVEREACSYSMKWTKFTLS